MRQPLLRSPLHSAIINNQSYKEIQGMLNQGADPNMCDYRNNTPLHFAVERGREDIAELLLHYKAHVNVQNCNGDTPLHWAIYSDADDYIIVNLVHSGASPHIKNSDGISSLDLAHNTCDITLVALINECLYADLG